MTANLLSTLQGLSGPSREVDYRSDEAYSEGFYDASESTPLFPDASPAYAAGWNAYWDCRKILEDAGFNQTGSLSFSKTTLLRAKEPRDGTE